jgi:ubiquinone/menaquinone biosynthesis C-methylase UbiE
VTDRELIEEQIRYYSRRAAEYDETSMLPNDPLASYGQQLSAALDRFQPRGRVLELACGTGTWTRLLVEHASDVVALDASVEMLEIAGAKVSDLRVRFVKADLFSWTPDDRYDAVCFFFWLSHVPPSLFEAFWDLVRTCLVKTGRVFFVDEGPHDFWREDFIEADRPVVRRTMRNGTTHRAVKVFWNPSDLQNRLHRLGWEISVRRAGPFYWGEGSATATDT